MKEKPIKKKKNRSISFSEKALENAFLSALRRANSYEEETPVEPKKELEPIDFEEYCFSMQQALQEVLNKSSKYHLIILTQTYAVICKKMQCVTVKMHNDDGSWMQPYEEKKERIFCVLKVIAWDDVKDVPEVARFIELGAPYSDVYVAEDIEDKL